MSLRVALERTARRMGNGHQFAAHAPFYPLCFWFEDLASGKAKGVLSPAELRRYTGALVRIYAGGRDDYDDRDPEACQKFVSLEDEPARSAFTIQLYPIAPHGWDQDFDAQFYADLACEGRGCRNINSRNAEITSQSIADLVAFMQRSLLPK